MAVKTITVTEDAYEALKRLKEEGESFSKVIIRVAKGRENIEKYFGVLNKKSARHIKENIRKFRKRTDKDYEESKHAMSR